MHGRALLSVRHSRHNTIGQQARQDGRAGRLRDKSGGTAGEQTGSQNI